LDRVLTIGEQAFNLDGEVVSASVMFTAIFRFQPSADDFDRRAVGVALMRYFSLLASSTSAHGGAIDAPIGDAAISYWIGESHAERACACARHLVATLASRSAEDRSLLIPSIQARIGIHSGKVQVGNCGSPERLRFTVIGDSVSLASRLSTLSGRYGYPIVISDYTKQLLPSVLGVSLIESVEVKGLDEPLELYGIGEPYWERDA
jgi:adenylate cyclase